MKKIVICNIAVLFLLCCNQNKSSSHSIDTNLNKVPIPIPAINKTVPKYTADIYKKAIPDSVFALLDKYLPDWHLPNPKIWDALVFYENKKNGMLLDYLYSDFNGDGKLDYSFILQSKKEVTVWILQSTIVGYETFKLNSLGNLDNSGALFEIGISLTKKGKITYINFDADDTKTLNLKNDAVTIFKFESAAETYFWKNGKYESVTTGD